MSMFNSKSCSFSSKTYSVLVTRKILSMRLQTFSFENFVQDHRDAFLP